MNKIINLYNAFFTFIYRYSTDIFKLFTRIYVADAFFRAGLTKLGSWDSEMPFLSSGAQYLFENEYQVPIISWELAAYLGTAAELILPIFLLLGLFGRIAAIELFLFNIIAVISYPIIWSGGFYDHKLWGIMLLVSIIYGPGKFSADRFIFKEK
ncbi:MAG: DoxX family protein [Gammaproteobacteria bacterium]|nr:DoxX family protein [Gammaproteobacteria bacterium]